MDIKSATVGELIEMGADVRVLFFEKKRDDAIGTLRTFTNDYVEKFSHKSMWLVHERLIETNSLSLIAFYEG